MIYLTGDTHGDFRRVADFCDKAQTTPDDVLVILGDAGINYYGDPKDARLKKLLATLPITLFCIHGNHEKRPESAGGYGEILWHGGIAYVQPMLPSIVFAQDGEIYDLDGTRCIAVGGAYSVDKYYRLQNGWGWWEDEQPSPEIKANVEAALTDSRWKIDAVLSHTCPMKYIPTEMFLSGIDQDSVDNSTEQWLDGIERQLNYRRWYCGHWHTDKSIDKMRFLFADFIELEGAKNG
jgi:3-oxoacid CoA-transferase subunit A